jgi:hypothetical protein
MMAAHLRPEAPLRIRKRNENMSNQQFGIKAGALAHVSLLEETALSAIRNPIA